MEKVRERKQCISVELTGNKRKEKEEEG